MNPVLSKTLKLGSITIVAALLLTLVNYYTAPVIASLKLGDLKVTLNELVSGDIENESDINSGRIVRSWDVMDGGTKSAVILELNATGFGGAMMLLGAYGKDGEIINASLLENNETVGFGKKAEDPLYMTIFIGTGTVAVPVPTTKSKVRERGVGPYDMINGSSITFSGISAALAEGSEYVKGGNW